MTTSTLLLVIWSALCFGASLAVTEQDTFRRQRFLSAWMPALGVGCVVWSIGVGGWMVAGFVVRAI